MRTKEEFIESLRAGIDSLCSKYEAEAEEHESILEIFPEYKDLLNEFVNCAVASEYNVSECMDSLNALGVICNLRLTQYADRMSSDDQQITEDMSAADVVTSLTSQFRDINNGFAALCIEGSISFLIFTIFAPTDREWEAFDEKVNRAKEKMALLEEIDESEFGVQSDGDSDVVDPNLGISKHEARLLENLMGQEFPEFAGLLRTEVI